MNSIKNKGQVSIFIIVGIILLVIIGLIFMMMSSDKQNIFEEDSGLEKNPVQTFVDSCIKQSIDEGLNIMRLQGGYIKIPRNVPTKMIKHNESVMGGVYSKEDGLIEVPYYIKGSETSYF